MTGRPHVCIITTEHRPKDDRIFHKEALSLARAGYRVSLIVPTDCEVDTTPIELIPTPPPKGHFGRHVGNPLRCLTMALRVRADVYHVHDQALLPVGLLLRVLGKKVIYDAHEDYQEKLKNCRRPFGLNLEPYVWRAWECFGSRLMSHNIVADPHVLAKFPPQKSTMVANFVPLHFTEVQRREDHDDRFRIVYVGGISVSQGIAKVIEALDRLDVLNAELHLAGPISGPGLAEMIAKHPKVVYHGLLPWEEVSSVLVDGHVGLVLLQPVPAYLYCPGHNCVKLFEYMGLGLPSLVSNFPRLKAFIESVDAGLAVDPTDPDAIAKALEYLYRNPAERKRMGDNGRRAVLELYNWEHEEKKLLAIYENLLRK